ncbi:hypothetical protein SAMN05444266_10178 [Chitinophaga jiangningensis]|uniref:Uncharacterized protein n=1 Tax=Chitinophaga jiangningensis TaxID=1419482 RepID=A0A1M6V610_9BACT|nr:hypothetical protein [Chitinophaga jiangningensis]SHK76880.1 hypothetical protein SAMN05444266_10178 [Chitinophaga jiangningensis]
MGVFNRIFVRRFYVENTGFFLVLFYFLFGVVNGANLLYYHMGLMEGFLSSTGFLALVLGLWLLYNFKCIGFVIKTFQLPQYSFLYDTMTCMADSERRPLWMRLHFRMYLPVFIYGGIAAVFGIYKHYYIPAGIILLFNIAMCIWPMWLYEKKLWQPDVFFLTSWFSRWLNRLFVKPSVLYFYYELFTAFPRKIFTTKLWSAAVLWLTFFLMGQSDFYDVRALQLGMIVCVLLHTQLMIHHRAFDEIYLQFLLNLPISTWRHYCRVVGVYALMLIPEAIILYFQSSGHFTLLPLLTSIITGITMLILFRVLLYFPRMNAEVHLRWILVISFILLFMILGDVTWYAIGVMHVLAAVIFFRKLPEYEPWIEVE